MCDYYDHPDPVCVQPPSCGPDKHLRENNGLCRRCGHYIGNDASPWAPNAGPLVAREDRTP